MALTESRIRELCAEAIQEAHLLRAHRGEAPKRHAEYQLLEKLAQLDVDASSLTLFVTLEPCIRRGPEKIPCAVRIQRAGIKNLYIGTLDPDPNITGRGAMYLTYAGVKVDFFPSSLADEFRMASDAFFKRFRSAHFWSAPTPDSLYGATDDVDDVRVTLAKSREGLLYQTLDLMIGSHGSIWIAAGDMSWFREIQVALLSAHYAGREVRVLRCINGHGNAAIDLTKMAASLGATVAIARGAGAQRMTMVGPESSGSASIFIDHAHATLARMPSDRRLLAILADWYKRRWTTAEGRVAGGTVVADELDEDNVLQTLVELTRFRGHFIS